MIPEIRVGEEAMRRLWLVEVGVEGVVVPVPGLDSEVLTAGARDASPNPGGQRDTALVWRRPTPPCAPQTDRTHSSTCDRTCDSTCDSAGGWPGVQGHVRLGHGLGVQPRHLLQLWQGHDGLAALSGRGGHQEGLLRGHRGGRQVRGADLLRHQLLLDFVDQDQVVQLKGEKAERWVRAEELEPSGPPASPSVFSTSIRSPSTPNPGAGVLPGWAWWGGAARSRGC